MSQINLVEPNILCSLYHLELPPEIVQRLYTEYIIDNKQKIEILYKTYNKYEYCTLYHTFSLYLYDVYIRPRPRLRPWEIYYDYLNFILYYDRYDLQKCIGRRKIYTRKPIQEAEKLLYKNKNKKNKNNKYTKKDTYYQNKARLKLKNY